MKSIIILMGIPGSGKGTQAKKIMDKFNYGHVSTGDLLRNLDKNKLSEQEYSEIKEFMDQGDVVPDGYIFKLAFPKIKEVLDEKDGVVLDGAIRTLEQAREYQEFFEDNNLEDEVLSIEIQLDEEEAIERLVKRGEDAEEKRSDDDIEIIKKRMENQGNEAIKPILDYYESINLLEKVDGSGSIDEVEAEIEQVLTNN